MLDAPRLKFATSLVGGRIAIPPEARDARGLTEDGLLVLTVEDDRIVIRNWTEPLTPGRLYTDEESRELLSLDQAEGAAVAESARWPRQVD